MTGELRMKVSFRAIIYVLRWAAIYKAFVISRLTQRRGVMSSIIAGREEEKAELLDAFNSNKAEFIVVYGRKCFQ